jgi:hypothetical protein
MAVSRNNQMLGHPATEVLYIDCDADSEIDGEKLSNIVGFASKKIGLIESGSDAEDSYKKYCDALEKKLGSYEPYHAHLTIKILEKNTIIKEMKDLLPQKIKRFDSLIEKAADKAVANLELGVKNFGQVFYRENENEYIASEFVVLKVFRASDNLEIIPCYMSVRGKKKEQRVLFVNWSESESYMEYKQQKFVMSKFEIKEIIEILKKEAKSKWA